MGTPWIRIVVASLCAGAASGCAPLEPRNPAPPLDLSSVWNLYYLKPRPDEVSRLLELVDADDLAHPERAFSPLTTW